MENPGYQDKDKLADAKKLAAMFKSGGKHAMSGNKARGDRSRNSSIPMKRQGSSQHQPRAAPPPPGTFNVSRGPLLKTGVDFLNYKAPVGQISPGPAQANAASTQIETKQTPGSINASIPVNIGITPAHENRGNVAKEVKVPASTHSPTKPETPRVSSNVDLLRGLIAAEPIQFVSKSSMETSNMATTFFSLMSQDSDGESGDSPDTEAEEEVGNKSSAIEFLRYTSDELLKLKSKAKNDVLPPDSIVRRTNAEHTNGDMRNTDSKGNTNATRSTSTIGRSKLAAAIGKASSHLKRPQEAGVSRPLTEAKPQATLIQSTITKTNALKVSSEAKAQPGMMQQVMDKFETTEMQAGPKLRHAVVQEVDNNKSQEEAIHRLLDKAEDPQVQAEPEIQIAVGQNSHAKPESVTTQKNQEYAISQEQVRGKTETSMGLDSELLRPQAHGFVPGLRVASLASFEVVLEPTQDADSLAASLLVQALVTPSAVAGNSAHSGPLLGQFITTVPIHLTDGELIPGQSRSQFVVPSAASPTDPMPAQLGTFSASLPFRIAESNISQNHNAMARVSRPRKPTKGLSASMWAK
ncbi:hypothetical protein FHETE_8308 [Fusarium heterosporum]|uniref:Uncharacterized protein n=1 Tax=Fusarium heterosporum TaxID=42747 RepID=A0A8H5SXA0_FUSHE|nr:hypothetical protein FHETE_8308 [Fusarium heterosporum]